MVTRPGSLFINDLSSVKVSISRSQLDTISLQTQDIRDSAGCAKTKRQQCSRRSCSANIIFPARRRYASVVVAADRPASLSVFTKFGVLSKRPDESSWFWDSGFLRLNNNL